MRIALVIVSIFVAGCASRPLSSGGEGPAGGGVGGPGEGGGGSTAGGSFDLAPGGTFDMRPGGNADMAPPADGGGSGGGPLFYPYFTIALPGQQDDVEACAVAIGDVTGDGRADVVVLTESLTTGGANVIAVYPQTATGQLGAAITYPLLDTFVGSGAVAIGDLNGDGRLDVAATGRDDVEVLYQNSAGGLLPVQSLTPTRPTAQEATLAVADFDGDGRVDIAAAGYQTGLDVWYQSADGTLGAPVNFDCSADALAVAAVADFDGDGRLDVALSGESVPTGCLLLQRPGGFAPSIPITYGALAEAIGAGDLNGDGRGELIAVGGGNSPNAYAGVAALTADDSAMGPFGWMSSKDIPGAVVVADIDGDQRADAVVVHIGWEAVGLYRQQPDGTLAAEELVDFAYINWGPNHLAVGDINSDGRPDIVVVDFAVNIMLHR